MFFRKKPIPIPDPGQPVRLLLQGTPGRREVRVVSEPYTNARGEVVVRVTEEREYQDAFREGRRAIGIPWPVKHMVVLSPAETLDALETAIEATEGVLDLPDVVGSQEGVQRWSWWRRMFGVE